MINKKNKIFLKPAVGAVCAAVISSGAFAGVPAAAFAAGSVQPQNTAAVSKKAAVRTSEAEKENESVNKDTGSMGSGSETTDPNTENPDSEKPNTGETPEKKNGLVRENGVTYYYIDGVKQFGRQKVNGTWYYFKKKSGAMGHGWVKIKGVKYYFGADGKGYIGRKKVKNTWYYFKKSSGALGRGWVKINGTKYYFNRKGQGVTGFQTISGAKYYFKSSGALGTGWKKVRGKKYYYGPKLFYGRHKIKGKYYYFDKKTGAMKTGWVVLNKKKYYYNRNGQQAFGTVRIGKTYYTFDPKKKGALTNTVSDAMDTKAQKYSSSTGYLILVNLSSHQVRVYKGAKGNWKKVRTMTCTNGKSSTPTVTGEYTVGNKGLYFDTGTRGRCWYFTQFHGNYLFHSVIYDRSSSPKNIIDGTMGAGASHGCVRLALNNAKWIYNNIPRNTKVVTYR